jgi:hypothetical protein
MTLLEGISGGAPDEGNALARFGFKISELDALLLAFVSFAFATHPNYLALSALFSPLAYKIRNVARNEHLPSWFCL